MGCKLGYISTNLIQGAQSNSMLAIAQMCKTNGWRFDYYCDNRASASGGNFQHALSLGMSIHSMKELDTTNTSAERLIIPQGGSCKEAEHGISKIAQLITNWHRGDRKLNVILPSGTGTTSYYLAKHLVSAGIQVYTVPCVGDDKYLYKQILNNLGHDSQQVKRVLHVISAERWKKFAHPYEDFYEFWNKVKEESHIELDLIYAPKTLLTLQDIMKEESDAIWLYIHTGGTLGNETQLKRFRRYKEC
jgi:1-aminocyclopropane-1-carboxylate deaminase